MAACYWTLLLAAYNWPTIGRRPLTAACNHLLAAYDLQLCTGRCLLTASHWPAAIGSVQICMLRVKFGQYLGNFGSGSDVAESGGFQNLAEIAKDSDDVGPNLALSNVS